MSIKKLYGVIIVGVMCLVVSPLELLAVNSTNYIIDPASDTTSIHHSNTSASFNLEGAMEPITGLTTTASYKVEHGSHFPGYCGDGAIDPTEDCEGTNLNGKSCALLGYTGGGTLACLNTCMFDYSGCGSGGGGGGGGTLRIPAPEFDPIFVEGDYTYLSSKLYYGTKVPRAKSVFFNGSESGVVLVTDSKWQKMADLQLGNNDLNIYSTDTLQKSSVNTLNVFRRGMCDINQDVVVDDYDLSLLVSHWVQVWKAGDLNEDYIVDDYDLSLCVSHWTT